MAHHYLKRTCYARPVQHCATLHALPSQPVRIVRLKHNRLQVIRKEYSFEFDGPISHLNVRLNPNNTAEIFDDDTTIIEKGSWSMMYDQAFFVDLPDSDRRFTANFRYNVKDRITPASYSTLRMSDFNCFDSDCGNTMIGFLE